MLGIGALGVVLGVGALGVLVVLKTAPSPSRLAVREIER